MRQRNPQQDQEEGFAPENPGCLHKRIVYSQKPQMIRNNLNPDASPGYLLHYDSKILQQSEEAPPMEIINRLLLALACLQQGRRDEARAIGENAFHEALAEGGVVIPLCEMILGMILLEKGDAKEAGEKLKNSAAFLMKLARQITPGNSSPGKVRPINLGGRGGNRTISGKPEKHSGTGKEDDFCLFRIQMFGPFRVFYRDEEIHASSWRTVKSRDLLAYLAHKAKPVSTGQILEDLWPDLDSDKASAVFHTTLYYLRRLIQKYTKEEIIIHGSKRYQLRPGSVLIDRYQFVEIARRVLGKAITETGADELETAAAFTRTIILRILTTNGWSGSRATEILISILSMNWLAII